eukprot:3695368-Rhodomonas_salina.1
MIREEGRRERRGEQRGRGWSGSAASPPLACTPVCARVHTPLRTISTEHAGEGEKRKESARRRRSQSSSPPSEVQGRAGARQEGERKGRGEKRGGGEETGSWGW